MKLVEKLRLAHKTELSYLKNQFKHETSEYIKKEIVKVQSAAINEVKTVIRKFDIIKDEATKYSERNDKLHEMLVRSEKRVLLLQNYVDELKASLKRDRNNSQDKSWLPCAKAVQTKCECALSSLAKQQKAFHDRVAADSVYAFEATSLVTQKPLALFGDALSIQERQ